MLNSNSTFLPLISKIYYNIPQPIRQILDKCFKWEYFGITVLTMVILGFHFAIINSPSSLVYDENHYVPEARSIIAGQGPINLVHPPLAKLFIISGIRLFGDNPVSWRFFSVLFGIISIVLFYFICRKLEMSKTAQFLATLVFAFENLNFVQSSVAMLDVYMSTFMLGGFLLYLSRFKIGSGLLLASSILSKLTGIFAFITIGIDWILDHKHKYLTIIIITISSAVSFLILLTILDSTIFGYLVNPFDRLKTMFTLSGSITFRSAFQLSASRPWTWLYLPSYIFYNYDPQILLMISITVWMITIPILIYMIRQTFKGNRASTFGLCWFMGTFFPIILMALITDRVTFLYYYYPVIGSICIGIGIALANLLKYWKNNNKSLAGKISGILFSGFITSHLILFILFSPISIPFIKWLPL